MRAIFNYLWTFSFIPMIVVGFIYSWLRQGVLAGRAMYNDFRKIMDSPDQK